MSLAKVKKCKVCESESLTWQTHIANHSGVQQNRLNTRDVHCQFFLGCDDCGETIVVFSAEQVADFLNSEGQTNE